MRIFAYYKKTLPLQQNKVMLYLDWGVPGRKRVTDSNSFFICP